MQKVEHRRREKRLVEKALGYAGITLKRFARKRCGVSPSFLRRYFRGASNSVRVEAGVQRFIDEHYPQALRHLEDDLRAYRRQQQAA
jgi:hypothetical protein